MRLARRTFLTSTVAAAAAPAVRRFASAAASQFVFKLHHAQSAVSSAHDQFLLPWARQVQAQSGGRIRIDLYPSMQLGGAPAQLYDQARDGTVDIVWAMPSTTPGRFPRLELFELPFVPARRALVSSKALEDFARAQLMDDFHDVHVICFSCSDRGVLHTSRAVYTIEDINGLRLHVQTVRTGDAIQALGGRPVAMPNAQLPMALNQHVVDGCVDPWDMVPTLRLNDLLKNHTDFAEWSLSTTTFLLAMNTACYERLPADLKKVIDANSGQLAAGMAGTMWDLQAAAVTDMVSQRGDPITTLLPDAVAHWRKATEPAIAAWLKEMKERKVDGGKLLAAARTALAKYAAEPEPQPPQRPAQPQDQQVKVEPNPTDGNAASPASAPPKASAAPTAPTGPTAPARSAPPPANPPAPPKVSTAAPASTARGGVTGSLRAPAAAAPPAGTGSPIAKPVPAPATAATSAAPVPATPPASAAPAALPPAVPAPHQPPAAAMPVAPVSPAPPKTLDIPI